MNSNKSEELQSSRKEAAMSKQKWMTREQTQRNFGQFISDVVDYGFNGGSELFTFPLGFIRTKPINGLHPINGTQIVASVARFEDHFSIAFTINGNVGTLGFRYTDDWNDVADKALHLMQNTIRMH